MGFLDDLKRQADAARGQQAVDTAALARNMAAVETACSDTLRYFMELAPQLNVLQLKPRVRFSLDSRTPVEGVTRGDFRVDSRRQRLREHEVFEHVVIHGVQKTGQAMSLTKDFPPEVERLENRLRQAGITPDVETRRDPDNGRLQGVHFRFVADIVAAVKLLPDHDQGRVTFRIANLDTLETVTAGFAAADVTPGVLDELARWLAGEPNGFLKLAGTVQRVEA